MTNPEAGLLAEAAAAGTGVTAVEDNDDAAVENAALDDVAATATPGVGELHEGEDAEDDSEVEISGVFIGAAEGCRSNVKADDKPLEDVVIDEVDDGVDMSCFAGVCVAG